MNALLTIMAFALAAGVIFVRPSEGTAAVVLCLALALPAGALAARAGGRFLRNVFVLGLLVRVFIGSVIAFVGLHEFFGGDALTYDMQGAELARVWLGQASYKELSFDLSYTNWGMSYMVAAVYAALGRNPLAVQYINSVLGAATAPVIYVTSHHVFRSLRVARLAAVLVAFYPSIVLWSSQGLKDAPIIVFITLAILATLKLGQRLSVGYALLLTGALVGIMSMRFYIFYMMAAAVGGSLLIGMRETSIRSVFRQYAVVVCVGLAMTYFGVLRSASLQLETFGNLETVQRARHDLTTAATGFGRDVDVSTTAGALSTIPLGMVYLLFAPFPWQLANLRQSITLPEMVAWWASFPLLVVGAWFTVRYRLRQALPILIFTTMLTLGYSVFQGNIGTAYRQRSQLLVFYFIFVAVGFVLARERREDADRQRAEQRRARALAAARLRQAQDWEAIADRLSGKVGF